MKVCVCVIARLRAWPCDQWGIPVAPPQLSWSYTLTVVSYFVLAMAQETESCVGVGPCLLSDAEDEAADRFKVRCEAASEAAAPTDRR